MRITDNDKKHITALLTSNYQIMRMKLEYDKNLLEDIQNGDCTEQQWQELYFRFLRDYR